MFTFKIKDKKEDELESIIEISGLTNEFTLNQCLLHQAQTQKSLNETETQIKVFDDQDKVALEMCPMLADIPEDMEAIARAYLNRKAQRPALKQNSEIYKGVLDTYAERFKDVEEQLGIKVPVLYNTEQNEISIEEPKQ